MEGREPSSDFLSETDFKESLISFNMLFSCFLLFLPFFFFCPLCKAFFELSCCLMTSAIFLVGAFFSGITGGGGGGGGGGGEGGSGGGGAGAEG